MKPATTLPRLLHHNAANFPNRPALREKRGGIWQELSWWDYSALVSRFSGGLAAHGFTRGDRLAVIGDNRPRLYAAMLAAQSLGGAAVPLAPDAQPEAVAQVLRRASVSTVVAEDTEQLEKIVAIKDALPGVRLVVQTTSHGMRQAELDWLKSFDAVADDATDADEQSEPAEPALFLYDPGTRDVTLSHASLLATADTLMASGQTDQMDESIAWLPMSSFADVLSSQVLALLAGYTCNCPETPETVWRDLREIGPTILIAPPRVWETMLSDIDTRAGQATGLKRVLISAFRAIAERAEQLRQADEGIPPLLRLKLAIGELLVCAPLRDQIGLRRLRWANTGGEQLAPRVLHGFHALGVNLKQEFDAPALTLPAGEPAHA